MTPRTALLAFAALIAAFAPFAADTLVLLACAAVLASIAGVLLRPGANPVFALLLGYQWLQVGVATLYAAAIGESLDAVYPVGDVTRATLLGMLGLQVAVMALALLVRPAAGGVDDLVASLNRMSLRRLLLAYVAITVVTTPLASAVGIASQWTQFVGGLDALRWAVLFLLTAAALSQRRGPILAALPVALEVVIGFGGFFAEFALPLMTALLAFVALFPRLSVGQRGAALALAVSTIALGVLWQGVKGEYRREVSGGTGEQRIVVGIGERYTTLGRMAGETVRDDLDRTLEKFVFRMAYIDYFGLVLRRVPSELPHRDGELLGAAVRHVVMPRLLFPDKPPLPSDSELTAEYTGNVFIVYMTGTSISLGYMTELYIDFGVAGVVLAGLLLAALVAGIALGLSRLVPDPAVAMALAVGALLGARAFETALPKLIGGALSTFLVLVLVLWLARGRIGAWLHQPRAAGLA